MKLYYTPGTCALADHIALEWVGQPFEARLVTREERKQPEYLAINPAGAVPALELKDGTVLAAERRDPEFHRRRVSRIETRRRRFAGIARGRQPMVVAGQLRRASAFQGVLRRRRLPRRSGADREGAGSGAQEPAPLYERLDAQLEGKDWVTGERSIVDPYLFVVLALGEGDECGPVRARQPAMRISSGCGTSLVSTGHCRRRGSHRTTIRRPRNCAASFLRSSISACRSARTRDLPGRCSSRSGG